MKLTQYESEMKKKYLKYKNKYLQLKYQYGGIIQLGLPGTTFTDIIKSDLTLVLAHGRIDINYWYVIPDNVYILTTTEIGSITCGTNTIFNNILNDNLKRTNLTRILNTKNEEETYKYLDKNIYKGGYVLYEPGDIIPKIYLQFYSNHTNNTELIYTYLKYPPYNQDSDEKNNFLNNYTELLFTNDENYNRVNLTNKKQELKLLDLIDLDKLKEYIKTIIILIRNRRIDINKIFIMFNCNDKYKKYFDTRNNFYSDNYDNLFNNGYNSKYTYLSSNEDINFITMILYILNYKKPKYDYDIKEIIDDIVQNSSPDKKKLLILTACLSTSAILNRVLTNHSIPINNLNLTKYKEIYPTKELEKGVYIDTQIYEDPNIFFPKYRLDSIETSDYEDLLKNLVKTSWYRETDKENIIYGLEKIYNVDYLKNIFKILLKQNEANRTIYIDYYIKLIVNNIYNRFNNNIPESEIEIKQLLEKAKSFYNPSLDTFSLNLAEYESLQQIENEEEHAYDLYLQVYNKIKSLKQHIDDLTIRIDKKLIQDKLKYFVKEYGKNKNKKNKSKNKYIAKNLNKYNKYLKDYHTIIKSDKDKINTQIKKLQERVKQNELQLKDMLMKNKCTDKVFPMVQTEPDKCDLTIKKELDLIMKKNYEKKISGYRRTETILPENINLELYNIKYFIENQENNNLFDILHSDIETYYNLMHTNNKIYETYFTHIINIIKIYANKVISNMDIYNILTTYFKYIYRVNGETYSIKEISLSDYIKPDGYFSDIAEYTGRDLITLFINIFKDYLESDGSIKLHILFNSYKYDIIDKKLDGFYDCNYGDRDDCDNCGYPKDTCSCKKRW